MKSNCKMRPVLFQDLARLTHNGPLLKTSDLKRRTATLILGGSGEWRDERVLRHHKTERRRMHELTTPLCQRKAAGAVEILGRGSWLVCRTNRRVVSRGRQDTCTREKNGPLSRRKPQSYPDTTDSSSSGRRDLLLMYFECFTPQKHCSTNHH